MYIFMYVYNILTRWHGGRSSVGDRVVNAALQLAIAALDGQVPAVFELFRDGCVKPF